MRLLHLSDLHLSRYGESGRWIPRADDDGAEVLHTWEGWNVEGLRSPKRRRADRLRLVDPEGVVHEVRSWPKRDDKAITHLLSRAMERHRTSAQRLIQDPPTPEELRSMLRLDPANTNLRFLEMLEQVLPLAPDLIAVTGDTTDNGFGYSLVSHKLSPWIQRSRLFVVPGNHDTYDMIPSRGRRSRRAAKEERFQRFAWDIGLAPDVGGAWSRTVGDVALVGLDSCTPPRTVISASGMVPKAQLRWLAGMAEDPAFRGARHRIVLLHHHLLRMPFAVGKKRDLPEMAMRLRNAPAVMEACRAAGVDLLMNGHRHRGYWVQLPNHPAVLSSPSSTLGCKFAKADYVWTLDLSADDLIPTLHPFHGIRAQAERGGFEIPDTETDPTTTA